MPGRKITQQELKTVGQLWSSTYLRLDQIANRIGRHPQTIRKIVDSQGFQRFCKNCKKQPVPSGRTQFCSHSCRDEYWRLKRSKNYRGKIICPICGKLGSWFNRIHVPTGKKIGECVQHSVSTYSPKLRIADKKKGNKLGGTRSKPIKTCYIPKSQWTP